jgi:hypothetical protein
LLATVVEIICKHTYDIDNFDKYIMKRKSKKAKIYKNKNQVFGYVFLTSILAVGILFIAGYYTMVPLGNLNVLPITGTTRSCTFTFSSEKKVATCNVCNSPTHYCISDYKSESIYYNLEVSGCSGGGVDIICTKTSVTSQHY